jgi:hypothetical protein
MRAFMDESCERRAVLRPRGYPHFFATQLVALMASACSSGCAIVPRSQVDECRQLTRTLRSENARLRDQLLAVQSQNRDYADRAVDDSRRLAVQDEAIERLESSVHAYQDERNRLEAEYRKIASALSTTAIGSHDASAPTKVARSTKTPPATQD